MKTMKSKSKVKTVRYIRSLPLNIIMPKTSREKVKKVQLFEENDKYSHEDTIINDSDEPQADIVHIMPLHNKKQFLSPLTFDQQEPPKYEIGDYKTYFYCIECLQSLIGVNKYINKYGSYIKIENNHTSNINEDDKPSILNNILIEKKTDVVQILKCVNCSHMIGIETNLVKYLLKQKIAIKNTKVIKIGLFGLKMNMLNLLSNQISSLCGYDSLIKINCFQQNKETLFTFDSSKDLAYKDINVMFIIHKIEGRVLLLGKNGYYNSLIKEMKQFVHRHIYFILIFKDYSQFQEEYLLYSTSHNIMNSQNQKSKKIIEEMVYKGHQEELLDYYSSGRIIILNELDMAQELNKYKIPLIKELKNKITILPQTNCKIESDNHQIEKNDTAIINSLLEEIKKEETTILFGESCYIL